jgi:flagellar secretion chaperone FliS
MQSTELLYRRSAAQGASGFGWLIALYDTLAGDLRRAANAERNSNLETRCRELNHALVVIGYLEDCIERASGGELAQELIGFYSSLRRKVIEAQVKRSPEMLEEQMERVLHLRESWQTMELIVHNPAAPDLANTFPGPMANHDQYDTMAYRSSHSTSWSA